MWKIWKEELYKIASRKLIWLGVAALLAFVTFRLYAERDAYSTFIGGIVFHGQEAIERDQALAAAWAGPLTEEKIRQIYEKYGFYYYVESQDDPVGNYCSRFVTEHFTNYMQTGGENPEEIQFYSGGDWERNAAPLLERQVWFDYVYGWCDFAEMYIFVLIGIFIILIIALSPAFSEEYRWKTADILLTTRRGKQSGIWIKILASLFFAAVLVAAVSIFLGALYFSVYGAQGLDASAVFLNFTTFYGYCPESIAGCLIFSLGLGLTGAAVLTGMVLGISALCRSAFPTVLISLAMFLFPLLWMKVFVRMGIFGMAVTTKITHFMTSMPFYLPVSTGFALSAGQIAMHLLMSLTVGIAGGILGYYKYRGYQSC